MTRPIRAFSSRVSSSADAVSICVAGACAVHCLAAPAIAVLVPLLGLRLLDPVTEWMFLMVSFVTSAVTLVSGCVRHHQQWRVLALFGGGATLLIGARLLTVLDGPAGIVSGAGLVVAAHAINIRRCRRAGATTCARLPSRVHSSAVCHH